MAQQLIDGGVSRSGDIPSAGIDIGGQAFFARPNAIGGSQGSTGLNANAPGAPQQGNFELLDQLGQLAGFAPGSFTAPPPPPGTRAGVPILPGASRSDQVRAAAKASGNIGPNGKPTPGFRPITNADGDIVTVPPPAPEEAAQVFTNILDAIPELEGFLNPVVASGSSRFVGDISVREGDIAPGSRLIQTPSLDSSGRVVQGQLVQQFVGNDLTQAQRQFNLSQMPQETQDAAFAANTEGSDLALLLQSLNPPTPKPSPVDQLLFSLIGGGGLGGGQQTQQTAPAQQPLDIPIAEPAPQQAGQLITDAQITPQFAGFGNQGGLDQNTLLLLTSLLGGGANRGVLGA